MFSLENIFYNKYTTLNIRPFNALTFNQDCKKMCGRYTLTKSIKTIESHFKPTRISLKYFPSFNENLMYPSYAGIRPILNNKDKSMRDFVIQSESQHSIPNLINLYGIESPGLTSSLAIAKFVKKILE